MRGVSRAAYVLNGFVASCVGLLDVIWAIFFCDGLIIDVIKQSQNLDALQPCGECQSIPLTSFLLVLGLVYETRTVIPFLLVLQICGRLCDEIKKRDPWYLWTGRFTRKSLSTISVRLSRRSIATKCIWKDPLQWFIHSRTRQCWSVRCAVRIISFEFDHDVGLKILQSSC